MTWKLWRERRQGGLRPGEPVPRAPAGRAAGAEGRRVLPTHLSLDGGDFEQVSVRRSGVAVYRGDRTYLRIGPSDIGVGVLEAFDGAVAGLGELPGTLVHGDLHAFNMCSGGVIDLEDIGWV